MASVSRVLEMRRVKENSGIPVRGMIRQASELDRLADLSLMAGTRGRSGDRIPLVRRHIDAAAEKKSHPFAPKQATLTTGISNTEVGAQ